MTIKESKRFMEEFRDNYLRMCGAIPADAKKTKARRLWKKFDAYEKRYKRMLDCAIEAKMFDLSEFTLPYPNFDAEIKMRPMARLGKIGYIYYLLAEPVSKLFEYGSYRRKKNWYHLFMGEVGLKIAGYEGRIRGTGVAIGSTWGWDYYCDHKNKIKTE